MKRTIRYFFYSIIICVPIILINCSSLSNEYLPLEVGNKWYYKAYNPNMHNAELETTIIIEVVGIDTVDGKKYFLLKYENGDNWFSPFYYYQRISNDTLYYSDYNEKRGNTLERITAIFNLDVGEIALLKLPQGELESENKTERLPAGRSYTIKVIHKDDDSIELFTDKSMIDGDQRETYKKGIGMIKLIGEWGMVIELIDYELNNY